MEVVLGERPDLWEEGLQGRRVLLVEDGMMNCRCHTCQMSRVQVSTCGDGRTVVLLNLVAHAVVNVLDNHHVSRGRGDAKVL